VRARARAGRADAEALVARTGIAGLRRVRAVELLLHQRLADRRIGRAWLLRPSPAGPLRPLLRADGLVARVAGLVALRADRARADDRLVVADRRPRVRRAHRPRVVATPGC
jgi:hypothetical protein